MRYLVTGGGGFIGSHIAERLVARGDEVVILDNFSTGSTENLVAIESDIEIAHGSVMDELLVDELMAESDACIHMGAAVGVRLIVEHPLKSFLTNIRGTETVLGAAHRYRKKVFIASTSEVYGKGSKAPFAEDDDRVLGSVKVSRWGYSISKAADEILAFAYAREKGLPMVIGRFFNTTGPRQSPAYGMVLPRFARQALLGDDLTVYGDGLQSRCFCHVRDVVDAVLRLVDTPAAEGDVFNIGSTEEITMVDLAELVIKLAGGSSRIRFVPYEEAYEEGFEDMRRRVPDITHIRDVVGWEPQHTLEEIVQEVLDDMKAFESSG